MQVFSRDAGQTACRESVLTKVRIGIQAQRLREVKPSIPAGTWVTFVCVERGFLLVSKLESFYFEMLELKRAISNYINLKWIREQTKLLNKQISEWPLVWSKLHNHNHSYKCAFKLSFKPILCVFLQNQRLRIKISSGWQFSKRHTLNCYPLDL